MRYAPYGLYDAVAGFEFLFSWGLFMKSIYVFTAALAFAAPAGLADTTNAQDAFQRSVQQVFVQNTIAGNWKTDCQILNDGSGSFSIEYLFTTAADALVVSSLYEDTACLYLQDSKLIDGSASLHSLNIDSYGNYVYGLTVANNESTHSLSFHLNLAESITVLTADIANQSFVLTKAE